MTNSYFYLEPYVYLQITSNKVLILNTINNKLILNTNKLIIKICRNLITYKNLYVAKIDNKTLNNKVFSAFFKDIKNSFSGDIILNSLTKPIQFSPFILNNINGSMKEKDPEIIMRNLNELTLYINSKCDQNCLHCSDYYKQFLYCTKRSNNKEFSLNELRFIFQEVEIEKLLKINVIGGNILKYKWLAELSSLTNIRNTSTFFYINILNINNEADIRQISMLQKNNKNQIIILINGFSTKYFKKIDFLVKNLKQESIIYHFIIEKDSQIDMLSDIDNVIKRYNIIPFYNGQNLSFFKNLVFTSENDIIGVHHKQSELLSKKYINIIEFGKLIIWNNGLVFGNINTAPLGNIFECDIDNLVYKEIVQGKSWRKRRQFQWPCKNCIYKVICPPISNYERILKRNNLCQVDNI